LEKLLEVVQMRTVPRKEEITPVLTRYVDGGSVRELAVVEASLEVVPRLIFDVLG
jgi:hypothetical protein